MSPAAAVGASAVAQTVQPTEKRFATLQAKFALLGRELTRHVRAADGRASYVVSRAGDSRYFGHWHDVVAHLSAIL